uniref:Uncharacterized protein n=1 Tax=Setaria italica TaxID=4555 RepID=K3XUH8_SETIT
MMLNLLQLATASLPLIDLKERKNKTQSIGKAAHHEKRYISAVFF